MKLNPLGLPAQALRASADESSIIQLHVCSHITTPELERTSHTKVHDANETTATGWGHGLYKTNEMGERLRDGGGTADGSDANERGVRNERSRGKTALFNSRLLQRRFEEAQMLDTKTESENKEAKQ